MLDLNSCKNVFTVIQPFQNSPIVKNLFGLLLRAIFLPRNFLNRPISVTLTDGETLAFLLNLALRCSSLGISSGANYTHPSSRLTHDPPITRSQFSSGTPRMRGQEGSSSRRSRGQRSVEGWWWWLFGCSNSRGSENNLHNVSQSTYLITKPVICHLTDVGPTTLLSTQKCSNET